MENYLINSNTVMLFKKNNKTVIFEKYKYIEIAKDILEIINESCKYYCSSLKGRIEGSIYLLGNNYKVPIIISETREIILFPTTSIKNKDCVWINYHQVYKYYARGLFTVIECINNKKIEVNVSNYIISKQLLKSSRLETILKSKKR